MRVSEIKNFLEPHNAPAPEEGSNALTPTIDSSTPVLNAIEPLLEAPRHQVTVTEEGTAIGTLTPIGLLQGINMAMASYPGHSIVELQCPASHYSASEIAHAVEDVNVSVADILTANEGYDTLRVTLKLNTDNPTSAIRNLERYGYTLTDSHSPVNASITTAIERFSALQAILSI